MGMGIGSAQSPAFDLNSVSLETAASGYEANQADTEFMVLWLSDTPLAEARSVRAYREAAERVFEATLSRPE